VLILGTLPGQQSLQLQQYYAQPRNVFWKLMGALVSAQPDMPYEERMRRLLEHRIALWDVCEAATRAGSLDASIAFDTIIPNPFDEFFRNHPRITLVCFNGTLAEALYRRHVVSSLIADRNLTYRTLPSTSPANAAMSFDAKLVRWRVALSVPIGE
jgi:hypoxanthine-DNA glycosylase